MREGRTLLVFLSLCFRTSLVLKHSNIILEAFLFSSSPTLNFCTFFARPFRNRSKQTMLVVLKDFQPKVNDVGV